jgi:hypothetical protein
MCLGFEYVSLNERRVVVLRYVEENRNNRLEKYGLIN